MEKRKSSHSSGPLAKPAPEKRERYAEVGLELLDNGFVQPIRRRFAPGVPKKYRDAGLSTFDTRPRSSALKQRVSRYLKRPEHSLFIAGGVGVGKTELQCVVCNELSRASRSVRWISFLDLVREIQDSFDPRTQRTEAEIIAGLREPDYLAIDDLGSDQSSVSRNGKSTDFVRRLMIGIIDHSYHFEQHVILTSNLDLEGLARWFDDEKVASRLSEMCRRGEGIWILEGPDHRLGL